MSTLHEHLRALEIFYELERQLDAPMVLEAIRDTERELLAMHVRLTALTELHAKVLKCLNSIELQLEMQRHTSPKKEIS